MSEARNGRQVYCVVTDKYGNTAKTNTVALRLAVTVTGQPKTAYAKVGETASVTVKAVGEGLTYKWYYKDVGDSKFYRNTAYTGPTYSVGMSEAKNGRQVYCIVADRYGHSVATNGVALRLAATITTQPRIAYAQYGQTASVSVKAVGDGLKYQWYVKNAGTTSYFKSATSATYSVKMVGTTKDRYLYCIITDQYGNSVRTNTVQLRMTATITKQPVNVTVASGSNATVTIAAAGDGLTYQWYYKDAGGTGFYRNTAFTGTSYSVAMSAARSGRQVYCVVTDKYGNSVKSNTVTLRMK